HIFKPISYLEIQLLSGVSGGYINISPELSDICEQKSDYWIYSDRYTKQKVNELGITIRNLEHKLRMAKKNLL
ncbi:hypothetical protein, partial [Klebsiella pneumoniae]|uniref:hypothetical protein n=1 Tax=Klebsiella pneumoniae TaxID=573 RepID=UPI001B8D90CC